MQEKPQQKHTKFTANSRALERALVLNRHSCSEGYLFRQTLICHHPNTNLISYILSTNDDLNDNDLSIYIPTTHKNTE